MRLARRILTPRFVLIAVYLGVWCKPQPLFAWSVASQNLMHHLLVAYELDKQHWTVETLLGARLDHVAVEREIEAAIQ